MSALSEVYAIIEGLQKRNLPIPAELQKEASFYKMMWEGRYESQMLAYYVGMLSCGFIRADG